MVRMVRSLADRTFQLCSPPACRGDRSSSTSDAVPARPEELAPPESLMATRRALEPFKFQIRKSIEKISFNLINLWKLFTIFQNYSLVSLGQPRKPTASSRAQAARWPTAPGLKGSIGEGPNHSNHSNHSNSFKIGIFRNFSLENTKNSENFNIF